MTYVVSRWFVFFDVVCDLAWTGRWGLTFCECGPKSRCGDCVACVCVLVGI
jgi:hypothetical protein